MRKKLDQVGKAALGVLGSVTLQSILGAAGLQITRRRRNISPTVLAFGAGVAVAAFAVGIVLFSGSLYLMALTDVRALGAVTPFGGVAFLIAWGALAWALFRQPARR